MPFSELSGGMDRVARFEPRTTGTRRASRLNSVSPSRPQIKGRAPATVSDECQHHEGADGGAYTRFSVAIKTVVGRNPFTCNPLVS